MAQWEFVEWLLFWILETSHFEFEFREGRVRVISARPAHRKERKQYEEILRKIYERI